MLSNLYLNPYAAYLLGSPLSVLKSYPLSVLYSISVVEFISAFVAHPVYAPPSAVFPILD